MQKGKMCKNPQQKKPHRVMTPEELFLRNEDSLGNERTYTVFLTRPPTHSCRLARGRVGIPELSVPFHRVGATQSQ